MHIITNKYGHSYLLYGRQHFVISYDNIYYFLDRKGWHNLNYITTKIYKKVCICKQISSLSNLYKLWTWVKYHPW